MLTHITSAYNHRDGFDDFPKISDHFPRISENSPNVVLSETTEQDLKMFQSYMHNKSEQLSTGPNMISTITSSISSGLNNRNFIRFNRSFYQSWKSL